jgi:hypothetical protein
MNEPANKPTNGVKRVTAADTGVSLWLRGGQGLEGWKRFQSHQILEKKKTVKFDLNQNRYRQTTHDVKKKKKKNQLLVALGASQTALVIVL